MAAKERKTRKEVSSRSALIGGEGGGEVSNSDLN